MVLFGAEALSQHDLCPGVLTKQLCWHLEHTPCLLEQIDTMLEGLRNFHSAAMTPEGRIRAISDVVMKNDEIPDIFNLELHLIIELFYVGLTHPIRRKHLHEPHNTALNEMDASRLQRLHEAAG